MRTTTSMVPDAKGHRGLIRTRRQILRSVARRAAILLAIIVPFGLLAQSEARRVTLTGDSQAFSIEIPKGWVVDTADRAMRASAKAVLIPVEVAEATDRTWMYGAVNIVIIPASKRADGDRTLERLVAYTDSLERTNKSAVERGSFATTAGHRGVIHVTRWRDGVRSASVFIEDTLIVPVLNFYYGEELKSLPNKAAFEAFQSVAASYRSHPDGTSR